MMNDILFHVTVTKAHMNSLFYFTMGLLVFSGVVAIYTSFRNRNDYKKMVKSIQDQSSKNSDLTREAHDHLMSSIIKIENEWDKRKQDFSHQEQRNDYIYKQLKSVSDAYRSLRNQMVKEVQDRGEKNGSDSSGSGKHSSSQH